MNADQNHQCGSLIADAVFAERERCAFFAEELARVHIAGAAQTRHEGAYTVRTGLWPFGKNVTCVRPGWERMALSLESTARSLKLVSRAIRDGWKAPKPDAKVTAEIADQNEDWGNVGTEAGS